MKEFNRSLYVERWVKHAEEDNEDGEPVDLKKEVESAKYYFDYVYRYEEYPR